LRPFLAGYLRQIDPSWRLCGGVLLVVALLAAWLGASAGRSGALNIDGGQPADAR
jgi:cyanate permease